MLGIRENTNRMLENMFFSPTFSNGKINSQRFSRIRPWMRFFYTSASDLVSFSVDFFQRKVVFLVTWCRWNFNSPFFQYNNRVWCHMDTSSSEEAKKTLPFNRIIHCVTETRVKWNRMFVLLLPTAKLSNSKLREKKTPKMDLQN